MYACMSTLHVCVVILASSMTQCSHVFFFSTSLYQHTLYSYTNYKYRKTGYFTSANFCETLVFALEENFAT